MLGKEFVEIVKDGIHPVVTFSKDIENQDGYLECGMRGRITGVICDHDNVFRLSVNLSEFDEFNKAFETANYHVHILKKNPIPVLGTKILDLDRDLNFFQVLDAG